MSSSITLIPRTAPFAVLCHLFDRRYFLRPDSVSVPLKFPAQMYTYEHHSKRGEGKKIFERRWQLQSEAFSCFSCYCMANSHGWLKVSIDQGEQNIPLCTPEVNLFPITNNTYMQRTKYAAFSEVLCVGRADFCREIRKVTVSSSSLLLNYLSTRLRRQTVRHVKVKDWHQMKDCLKSELPKLYAHHLSCYQ